MSNMLNTFLEEDIQRKQNRAAEKNQVAEIPRGIGGSRARRGGAVAETPTISSHLLRDGDTFEVNWAVKKMQKKTITRRMIPTPQMLLRKSILFFGDSGSGKTFLINHFMYLMRNCFPIVEVFCPTNSQNQSYAGTIPPGMIHERVLLSDVRSIYDRQKIASSIAKIAKNPATLHKLFVRVITPISKEQYIRIRAGHEKEYAEIDRDNSLSQGQKKTARETAKDRHNIELRKFYRTHIGENIKRFNGFRDLDEDEHIALKYRNFNPNMLAIFDDAMTEIKSMLAQGKKEHNDTISEFFYRGRHADVTHWYVFQDDNHLDTGIRTNAFITIFTCAKLALSYFTKASNKFSKEEQAEATAIIGAILPKYNPDGSPNYKKLVYNREAVDKFSYIQADDHGEFRMGSELVWKFCGVADNGGINLDASNPYLQKFVPRAEAKFVIPSHRQYPPN